MRKYIGVKLVDARPMNLGDYNHHRGWTIPANEDPERDGYLVCYPDGYESWSPKEQFEAAYFGLGPDQEAHITHDDVTEFVDSDQVLEAKMGNKTAVVLARCRTGFELVGMAECDFPNGYKQEVGTSVALGEIMDKIWSHLDFVLQWAKHGLNATQKKGE